MKNDGNLGWSGQWRWRRERFKIHLGPADGLEAVVGVDDEEKGGIKGHSTHGPGPCALEALYTPLPHHTQEFNKLEYMVALTLRSCTGPASLVH